VPVAGLMCALVPSLPEASLVALREFGTKSFSQAIAPALELADGAAIDEMTYFLVVLSSNSVDSRWVQEELAVAMTRQFKTKGVTVLPVLLDDVADRIPPFLRDRVFADFRTDPQGTTPVALLLRSMGAVETLRDLLAKRQTLIDH